MSQPEIGPIEPPPTQWEFPDIDPTIDSEVVGVGADLQPGTLLAAYRQGMFPMPVDRSNRIAWWSPDPRGIIELDDLRVSRSLRRSVARYHVTANDDFEGVIDACRQLPRDGGWISQAIRDAYVELHRLGWAHSIETWDDDGALIGGLYGVGVGGLFAGESMFSTATDASKVALVELVRRLRLADAQLLDIQWSTDHLETLGASTLSREAYLARAKHAVRRSPEPLFTQMSHSAS